MQRVRGSVRVGVRVRNHSKLSREGRNCIFPSRGERFEFEVGRSSNRRGGKVSSSSNSNLISMSGGLAFSPGGGSVRVRI